MTDTNGNGGRQDSGGAPPHAAAQTAEDFLRWWYNKGGPQTGATGSGPSTSPNLGASPNGGTSSGASDGTSCNTYLKEHNTALYYRCLAVHALQGTISVVGEAGYQVVTKAPSAVLRALARFGGGPLQGSGK